MKKIHSLFILSILALTMFVGCQNPTDGTGNGAEAVETEYTITINSPHGTVELDKKKAKAGETVKLTKLEADDGYRLETMSIKKENGEDVTELDRKNQSFIMPNCNVTVTVNFKEITPTYTVSVPSDSYTTSSNSSYKLVIKNAPIDGYKKGDPVEILITNGNFDVNTGYGTPEGLYLVKVSIEDSNGNDIKSTVTGLKIEDNKITFTMPDKDVMVRADFEDVVCRPFDFNSDVSQRPNRLDVDYIGKDSFRVALRFDNKEYDNLEPFGEGKFIYEFYNLESARVGSRWYFYIQLGNDYNVYDYENPENCKYHETPVVIYNDTMYEPVIGSNLGNRYVNLDAELNQN